MMPNRAIRVISNAMSTALVSTAPGRSSVLPAFVLATLFALSLPVAAHAAREIKPWVPSGTDSLTVWTAEARQRFQMNTGDSVGGGNYRPYDLVGAMGRRLIASLGRSGMNQAHAVEGVLDSLGLDTEIAVDPRQDGFALLLVRNPFKPTAAAVGYLYWFRDRDLRSQGVIFHGSRNARMRVWWTAKTEWPYQWAIVSDNPNDNDRMSLLLLKLNEQGTFWVLQQYENAGPDLGGPGDAIWADVNGGGEPELAVWTEARADTTFEECRECPKLRLERMYVLRPSGYELYDSRLMPSPYATFTLFIRLLQQQSPAGAQKLLSEPERVATAVAAGWGRRGRGVWSLEYSEAGESWPTWLAFKLTGPKGPVRYIVHFEYVEGRWLIRDWVTPRVPPIGKGVTP